MTVAKFFKADLQAISAFRILLGLVLLADFLFYLLPVIPEFYYDTGYAPRHIIMQMETRAGYLSLLQVSGHPWIVNSFAAVYFGAILCFIAGYRTTLAKWLVFICYISFVYRTPILDSGAEMLMRLFLLWSLFVPMHRYWSVDAALSRQPRDTPVPPIFIAAIKLQITWLYLFSGIFKLYGSNWRGGTAIEAAMSDTVYGSALGVQFADFVPWLMPIMTYAVIVFQLTFSAMVYSPFFNTILRSLAIMGALAMHTAFLILLRVGMFPFLCAVYLVLLIPDAWINKGLEKRRARFAQIKIFYDPDCGFCEKISLLFREFCLSTHTQVLPASANAHALQLLQTHNSWVVMDEKDGKTYLKWDAVSFVLKQTPLFWPLGALNDVPLFKGAFRALYDSIGKNRPALGKFTASALPWHDTPYHPTSFAKALCSFLVLTAFVSNVLYLPTFANQPFFTRDLKNFIYISQAYQRWNLFAPEPVRNYYDYALEGITAGGKSIDLRPLFEEGRMWWPEPYRAEFQSHRWAKFFTRFYETQNKRIVRYVLSKVGMRYNSALPQEERETGTIVKVKITLRTARTIHRKENEPPPITLVEEVDLSRPQTTPPSQTLGP